MHYTKVIAALRRFKADMPKLVGNEMVNFALDNIRAEGFEGVPWAPRKANAPRNNGRGLLKDTGEGERSIRVSKTTDQVVEVTANEYMEAHNTGATIRSTHTVRAHGRRRKGRVEQVKAFTRTVDFTLPTRTMLAPSQALNKRIITTLLKRFKTLIK